jgi:hypothetical protein
LRRSSGAGTDDPRRRGRLRNLLTLFSLLILLLLLLLLLLRRSRQRGADRLCPERQPTSLLDDRLVDW